MKLPLLAASLLIAFAPQAHAQAQAESRTGIAAPWAAPAKPFVWENATVYFLLTDRFNNGNPANDLAYERKRDAAVLRVLHGGRPGRHHGQDQRRVTLPTWA